MPKGPLDVLTLLRATYDASQSLPLPLISMSMGPYGSLSRMVGFVYGSALTWAVGKSSSAPGQIPIEDLRAALATGAGGRDRTRHLTRAQKTPRPPHDEQGQRPDRRRDARSNRNRRHAHGHRPPNRRKASPRNSSRSSTMVFERARKALAIIETYDQARVDRLCQAVAWAVGEQADVRAPRRHGHRGERPGRRCRAGWASG